ncbi:MAG: hypothetical protein QNJ69_09870 [Gammaproteobacteria bacterium]|nr:hypothetical protein [Gammaproteobacteria bacterium]
MNKKQPAGFEDSAADDTDPPPTEETGTAGTKPANKTSASRQSSTQSSHRQLVASSAGKTIDRKKLIKMLAIVAVSAGAIYLLKQRFLR